MADTEYHYPKVSRTLHWLMAALIVIMLALGWFMMSIEDDPDSQIYFQTHRTLGMAVFLLVVVRLLYRWAHPPERLPISLAHWQILAAKLSHGLLYFCMFAMPITGLIGTLLSKDDSAFLGFKLPRLIAANHDLAESFFSIHGVIAWIFVGLISVHALAAFKHLLVEKDRVFQRMWFQK